MKVLGIDEAGRGPVIGDMVMAGVMIDEEDESKFGDIGVKDSKLIAPNKRKSLFKEIQKITEKYHIIEVSPKEIDEAVFSKEMNLNKLEAVKSAMIINKLKPDKAIVDCPSNNTSSYEEYLRMLLKDKSIELVVENKADFNYLVVGAASILAKVTRDEGIEKIKKKYGNIGSGYPADPNTKRFIMGNFEKHPEIFRKSWATFKNLKSGKTQKKLGEF
jgi:ribonuclease HII